ncbi:MAG: secretin N-terminal domain-containing protein [Verrucomicrobia bacterium]|nr:secretin N-terminal domain-containing protein [Verrucomicrobiota bacterium]
MILMASFGSTAGYGQSPRDAQATPLRPEARRLQQWQALDREVSDDRWPDPELLGETSASETAPADSRPTVETPSISAMPRQLYSFSAAGLDLKSALALFARANQLNVVPDNDVDGVVTLDVHDLPLASAMRALLEAADCSWSESEGLIRVRTVESRTFLVDYLRLQRKGLGQNSATLAAGTAGGGTTIAGGGGSAGGGAGANGGGGAGAAGGSTVQLTAENSVHFWGELREDLERLLTPRGRESLAINSTAGLIVITDRPSAVRRVEGYLRSLQHTVHRQVEIEARLYDVTLNDQSEFGINWEEVIQTSGGALGLAGTPIVTRPLGGFDLSSSTFTLAFENGQASVFVKALREQGEVRVISKPRLRTLNNQTALIKVGTEVPFFQNQSTIVPGGGTTAGASAVIEQDTVLSVTVGTILAITPQISEDQWISLDISPVLTSLIETKLSPNRSTTAPVLDIKQASTLLRVRNGTTIVLGGLIQTESALHRRKIPGLGDIPWLGRLFQGDFNARRKKELVMLITPRIIP